MRLNAVFCEDLQQQNVITFFLKKYIMKKAHFTKYLEFSKREIRMFTFRHLNFE